MPARLVMSAFSLQGLRVVFAAGRASHTEARVR